MEGRRLGIDRDVVTYSQYGMAAAPAGAAGQFMASARMKVAPGIIIDQLQRTVPYQHFIHQHRS